MCMAQNVFVNAGQRRRELFVFVISWIRPVAGADEVGCCVIDTTGALGVLTAGVARGVLTRGVKGSPALPVALFGMPLEDGSVSADRAPTAAAFFSKKQIADMHIRSSTGNKTH